MCLPRWRIQSIVFLIAVRDFIFGNQNVTKQHSVAAGNALAMLVAYVTTSVALCLLPM